MYHISKNLNKVTWFSKILNDSVWLLAIMFNNICRNICLMCLVGHGNRMLLKKKKENYILKKIIFCYEGPGVYACLEL